MSEPTSPRVGYRALWKARIQLMRPGNAVMAAVGALVGMALAANAQTTWYWAFADHLAQGGIVLWAAPLAAFLLTGFGNTLNDIADRKIDRQAHPNRPLARGTIRVTDAKAWLVLLLVLGGFEAWLAGGTDLLGFALINVGVMGAYEARLKQLGLPGNIAVGYLVGSTFLFGAVAWGGWQAAWLAAPLAAMAALSTVARELIKDLEDVEADRAVRRTFPSVAGPSATVALAAVSILCAVGYAGYHAWTSNWAALPGGTLLVAVLLFGTSVPLAMGSPARSQRVLKLAMLVAMVAFLLPGRTFA